MKPKNSKPKPSEAQVRQTTSSRLSFCKAVAVVCGVIVLSGGCSRDETQERNDSLAAASHQKMLGALKTVRNDASRESHWFGKRVLEDRRVAVAAITDAMPIKQRFDRHFLLGLSELRHGTPRQAISQFEQAEALFLLSGFPAQSLDSCRYHLGLSYFRLGENENCCKRPGAESCVFPVRGEGLHVEAEGSRNALVKFLAVAESPDAHPLERANAKWLAVVAAMTLGEYPQVIPPHLRLTRLDRALGNLDFPRFQNIAAKLGVNRFGLAGAVVVDDFDGDGDDDLITSSWDPKVDLAYFERLEDGSFVDRSEAAGLVGLSGGLNLRHADFDNDGDLDLLVLRGGWMEEMGRQPNSLLRNDGAGHFVDVAFACGLADEWRPTQTAEWADFDLDGDLDLFVGNEAASIEAPSQLFRNDGPDANGMVRFVDVAREAGVTVDAYVKGASWGDYNGDRLPDLYVSCFSGSNRLFQNHGDGTFTDVAKALGVSDPVYSFPVWFWDYNNDGHLDLFVSGFSWRNDVFLNYFQNKKLDRSHSARLYRGDARGRFVEVSVASGLEVPMMSMGSNFGDLDNDGFADIYLGTGTPDSSSVVPNLLLMNRRGQHFENMTTESGLGHLQKGHGISLADFDRDGDLDIFEQMGGAFSCDAFFDAVYENPGFGNHWIEIRLKGQRSNSYGIGCRLRVLIKEGDGERSVYTWLNSGGSFGSNALIAHLGIGQATRIERLEVYWPVTDETQVIENPPINSRIVVTEAEAGWKYYADE